MNHAWETIIFTVFEEKNEDLSNLQKNSKFKSSENCES